jgi:hypothetical protein
MLTLSVTAYWLAAAAVFAPSASVGDADGYQLLALVKPQSSVGQRHLMPHTAQPCCYRSLNDHSDQHADKPGMRQIRSTHTVPLLGLPHSSGVQGSAYSAPGHSRLIMPTPLFSTYSPTHYKRLPQPFAACIHIIKPPCLDHCHMKVCACHSHARPTLCTRSLRRGASATSSGSCLPCRAAHSCSCFLACWQVADKPSQQQREVV